MAQKYTREYIKDTLVPKYANKWGIPVSIAQAVINHESGYNPKAVSKVGAQGLGQIMPETGKRNGLKDPFDPDQNLDVAMKLLRNKFDTYGNWITVFASYNAGPGHVSDYLNGTNKYGENPRHVKTPFGVPNFAETRKYVKNICAAAHIDTKGIFNPPVNKVVYGLKNNEYKFFDKETGLLNPNGVNDLVSGLKRSAGTVGLRSIETNRPELLEDKPQYKAYANLRKMKNADGQPLFKRGNQEAFVASIARQKTGLSSAGVESIAADMVKTQTDAFNPIGTGKASSLYELFKQRYEEYGQDGSHGLANLTNKEYMDYGLLPSEVEDPVMQARVLAQEYQRAEDSLGSEKKAVCALGGGRLIDENGKIASWKEIKSQEDAYLKDWKIYTGQDGEDFDKINTLISSYESLRNIFGEA